MELFALITTRLVLADHQGMHITTLAFNYHSRLPSLKNPTAVDSHETSSDETAITLNCKYSIIKYYVLVF